MGERVIVLGGGVGGMSAAHELAERGFEVTVYETRPIPGGKSRSMPVPDSGTDGRRDLPGEHGFRFFPGFYRHLPDTMKRIPFGGQPGGVFANLVPASAVQMARDGGAEIISPAHSPATLGDLDLAFRALLEFATNVGIPLAEQLHFIDRLLLLLTSCEQRRFAEYERQSWWEFSGAQRRSAGYQKFLADGLTRSLVAAKAREMSARTGGYILLQLLFDLSRPGGQADRVLNGPSSEVWIDPWLAHLQSMGVDYKAEHQVQALQCRDGGITGVSVVAGQQPLEDAADYYVAAVPVEVMRLLASDEIKQAEPRLARLHRLRTRWMNGMMFYLDCDVPLVRGHTIYIDSPWALTSISQAQFWPNFELEQMGDGRAEGILSVDVSEWEREGSLHRKQAVFCSTQEIREEVWAQLKAGLNDAGMPVLVDVNVVASFLDPSIVFPTPIRLPIWSRCWSTQRALGATGRTPSPRSATCSSHRITCAPTPIWRPWRAPTRRPGGPSTASSLPLARTPLAVRCGRCASPRSSRRRGRSTACASNSGGHQSSSCASVDGQVQASPLLRAAAPVAKRVERLRG